MSAAGAKSSDCPDEGQECGEGSEAPEGSDGDGRKDAVGPAFGVPGEAGLFPRSVNVA